MGKFLLDDASLSQLRQMWAWFRQQKFTSPVVRRRQRPGSVTGIIKRAKTQEAAQADEFISVKLLDNAGEVTGNAFDAKAEFTDGATACNTCLPRVTSGVTIFIAKIDGTWYIVNPTFTDSDDCDPA